MNYTLIHEQVSGLLHSPSPRLALSRMCAVLEVRRDNYYRWLAAAQAAHDKDDDLAVRDAIQRIALEMPSYGYRTITRELARRGFVANHKRVLRLMREDNLRG